MNKTARDDDGKSRQLKWKKNGEGEELKTGKMRNYRR